MRKPLLIGVAIFFCTVGFAQSYNTERTALTNYLKRMYENASFEGVKVVKDYDSTYLLSVITLYTEKYKDKSTMFRVASVKAQSQASRFFNGSKITSDLIIYTTGKADGTSETETIEHIHEHAVGYVKSLELLTNFKGKDGKQVFLFLTPIH